MRRGLWIAIGIAVGVAALWWSRRADSEHASPSASGDRVTRASGAAEEAGVSPSAERAPSAAAPAGAGKPARSRSEAAAARERLVRDIARARERRLARAAANSPPAGGAPTDQDVGQLDKEYIRDRVKEIVPLVAECYEMSLADEPTLAGTVVVHFVMAGEPEVGGVVESSEIDAERSTLSRPALDECIRETMYALEFDPPEDGGRVEVRYPFKFRSEPE